MYIDSKVGHVEREIWSLCTRLHLGKIGGEAGKIRNGVAKQRKETIPRSDVGGRMMFGDCPLVGITEPLELVGES